MNNFVTSIPAQAAARCIIETARSLNLLDAPVAVSNELAEAEKTLIVKMFKQMDEYMKSHGEELAPDVVSSLFTFVFAKAAETAAQLYEGVEEVELSTEGMFSLSVPIAAGELLNNYSADLDFPSVCLEHFLELSEEEDFTEPFYSLFEALKWCYRISFHIFWDYLEQQQ